MVTRITSSNVSSSLTGRINSSYSNYAKITEQLTTGYKINSLSDDAVQAVNIINSTRKMNQIGTWITNSQALNNEVKESSDVIDLAITKAQRAKDLAGTAATGTSTKETLTSILIELDEIINTVVDRANTNYNGNYIYSGANTKTPPYEVQYAEDATGNLTDKIIGIKYNGTPMDVPEEWMRQLEIADGVFQNCNLTGIEVFGESKAEQVFDIMGDPVVDAEGNPTYTTVSSSGIMGDLINFRNAIQTTIDAIDARDSLPDTATEAERQAAATDVNNAYDAINGLLDNFTASIEKMTTANVKLGRISNKLDMSETSLTESKDNLKEFISNIKDIDVTSAISEWYNAQYAYQASMQASLSSMQYNLLNYLS